MAARYIFLICILLMSCASVLRAEDTGCSKLKISGPPEYYPLAYLEGISLRGIGIDLAKQAAADIGVVPEVIYKGSWTRALQLHAMGEVDLLVSLYKNTEREKTMHFLPAFWTEKTLIVVRRDQPIKFEEWDDLKPYRGVTVSNDSRGEAFDTFMRDELDVLPVHSQKLAFRMLRAGRVNYMVLGEYSIFTDALTADDDLMVLPTPVDEHKVHMAMAKKSPCTALVPKLSAAIEALVAKGAAQAIFEHYPVRAHH